MRLHRLKLKNYRNYEELNIEFDSKIHFFIGDNAQGKTNLLESIYMLALTKSHRTNKDRELIYWGKEFASIHCDLTLFNRDTQLEVNIFPHGKKVLINRIDQRKISNYLGKLKVVLFAPEDLQLIKGSPNQRRKFMDRALGQIRPKYINQLSQYQKVLLQRNQLLKDSFKNSSLRNTIDIWDCQLLEYGSSVIDIRQQFIQEIGKLAQRIHFEITEGIEQLNLYYDANCLVTNFREKIEKSRERDFQTGTTNVGPHRDELQFTINDIDAKIFGSQGQQRTVALSLKLAELEYMKMQIGDMPILLLDDVLSELDIRRQKQLLDSINDSVQTFVTTTDVSGIKHEILKQSDFFYIKQGNILKKT
jgi:DNA replication and repair protein RecF